MWMTTFLCPWHVPNNLSFPQPCPLDLDGPYALISEPGLVLPTSTTPGHPLGFPASLHSMVHRNWKPCSWDALGTARAGFQLGGSATTPGPVTGGTEFIEADVFPTVEASWEDPGFPAVKPQPEFFRPTPERQMIDWSGTGADGFYPIDKTVYVEDYYPVLMDSFGMNSTGCYIGVAFRIFGQIEPYFWSRNNQNYLIHEIRIDCSFRYYFDTGGSEVPNDWILDEGQNVNFLGGGVTSRNTAFDRKPSGSAEIRDATGQDPTTSWGSVILYAQGSDEAFGASLTLRVISNFLPIPD